MNPHFRFISSYRGEFDYQVTDATGTYRATFHVSAEPWSTAWNYTQSDYARDVAGAVGLLTACCRTIPEETVTAFNAWRAAEYEDFCQHILSRPDRYEVTDRNDPFLAQFAPMVARGAVYVVGFGWRVTSPAMARAA